MYLKLKISMKLCKYWMLISGSVMVSIVRARQWGCEVEGGSGTPCYALTECRNVVLCSLTFLFYQRVR